MDNCENNYKVIDIKNDNDYLSLKILDFKNKDVIILDNNELYTEKYASNNLIKYAVFEFLEKCPDDIKVYKVLNILLDHGYFDNLDCTRIR